MLGKISTIKSDVQGRSQKITKQKPLKNAHTSYKNFKQFACNNKGNEQQVLPKTLGAWTRKSKHSILF